MGATAVGDVNLRQGHLILFVVAYKFVLFLDKKEERRGFI
jgi:hypothetical protein